MLEDAGAERIFEASDAASGYKLWRRHRPDVVIIDLSMQESGLGGLPLIRRMRMHDPNVRIIVFSMHGDPAIVARALEAGASGMCSRTPHRRASSEPSRSYFPDAHI